jgi:hypothetical protein|tara:strand:+ start:202 stop:411 length:210 start_codon:yes stop_codon:yes gene_type:complete
MDLVDFSQKLYKLLKEREDDIIITLTTGAVQNHEQYKQLVGELQGLSYTRDQMKSLLEGKIDDEDLIRT